MNGVMDKAYTATVPLSRRSSPVGLNLPGDKKVFAVVQAQPYSSKMPMVAVALALIFVVQVIPQSALHVLAPADAAAVPVPNSPKFGARGAALWANYDLSTYPQMTGVCGCEPTMGVDWVHGNGKDAMFQAFTETICVAFNDAVTPLGAAATATPTDCTSPFNNAVGAPPGAVTSATNPPVCAPTAPPTCQQIPASAIQTNYDPILYTDFDGGRTFAGGLVINPQPPAPVCPVPVPGMPVSCVLTGCSNLSYTDTNNGGNRVPQQTPLPPPPAPVPRSPTPPPTPTYPDGWRPVTDACSLPAFGP